MRIFKHRRFCQWAKSERLADETLKGIVSEIESGLHDGNLGAGLYKKRVAMSGRGKRGGYRVLLAFKHDDRTFFIYGFSKNDKSNIDDKETTVYKELAQVLLNANEITLTHMIQVGSLIEVI